MRYPAFSIESRLGPPNDRLRAFPSAADPRQAERALDAPQAFDRVDNSASTSSPGLDVA